MSLGLPDRGLFLQEEYIRKVAGVIRTYKPQVIFAPYHEDRHPDHGNCTKLVEEAVFFGWNKKNSAQKKRMNHIRLKSCIFI